MYKLNLYISLSVFKVSYFMANNEFQTNKQTTLAYSLLKDS